MFSEFHFNFRFKRQHAQMHVCWNNGYCWGRIVTKDGREFDVHTARDYYDDHVRGAEAFERAAKRGKAERAQHWTGMKYDSRLRY